MSIISSYPNDTFTIELKSNGPYIHCKYLKILNNTKINIEWYNYTGGIFENKKWINKYDIIKLGDYNVTQNSIIDIANKFSNKLDNSLIIDTIKLTNTHKTTNSDKYIITFIDTTVYNILTDSYVDH